MFPILITIAKGALIAVFIASFLLGMWLNSRLLRRQRESGYRLFDPRRSFAGWKTDELFMFVIVVCIGVGAGMALNALK
jgi:hypothetical protein